MRYPRTPAATVTEAHGLPGPASNPPNLHLTTSFPSSAAAPLSERVERKFFVPPNLAGAALALLRGCCRPDQDYPAAQVNSLYFDTPSLDQYEASDSGEFAKDKVRVRWYGRGLDPHRTGRVPAMEGRDPRAVDAATGHPVGEGWGAPTTRRGGSVGVWLELKSRRGFASTKQRLALEVSSEALASRALVRGIVPTSTLLEIITDFGFFVHSRLCPVVAISYWRYRFVEPGTGFRVSLDSRIRSTMVMPGIGGGERGLALPGVVVEVKGSTMDLPRSLHGLVDLGSSWTRYSKYSSSLDGHGAARGSVSRLWPSGLLSRNPGERAPVVQSAGRITSPSPRWAPRLVGDHDTE